MSHDGLTTAAAAQSRLLLPEAVKSRWFGADTQVPLKDALA